MKYHYHSFNFLITLKVDKIMKFSYSKREKNDQLLHYNFMIFGYYEFEFYELLNLPTRIKSKSKIFLFWGGFEGKSIKWRKKITEIRKIQAEEKNQKSWFKILKT